MAKATKYLVHPEAISDYYAQRNAAVVIYHAGSMPNGTTVYVDPRKRDVELPEITALLSSNRSKPANINLDVYWCLYDLANSQDI